MSNEWEMDLALSVTHFPFRGVTFAVLFGSYSSLEDEIVRRLEIAGPEIYHPLLMPGIFIEL